MKARGHAELKLTLPTTDYLALFDSLAVSTIANERLQKGDRMAAGKQIAPILN